MRWLSALTGLWWLLAGCVQAQVLPQADWPELQLLQVLPVEGMPEGNLSGLARCAGELQAISDREDDRLYHLRLQGQAPDQLLQASAERWQVAMPSIWSLPPDLLLTLPLMWPLRGGTLDFEGMKCDAAGNRYVVSETFAAVLQISPQGDAHWLALPPDLFTLARRRGLWQKVNAIVEGLAVSADGQQLWLAAEREQRGLLALHLDADGWHCSQPCVLLTEGGDIAPPPDVPDGEQEPVDFAGLVWHAGYLFTLDRQQALICRHAASSGVQQRCWSFRQTLERADLRYAKASRFAEALWLDEQEALIGIDNNNRPNAAGERRPLLWRMAAPPGGWLQ